MSVPDPVINFRGPAEVKAALDLMAKRRGTTPGVLLRQWVVERLLWEHTLDTLRSVGYLESAKRLSTPTYVESIPHTDTHVTPLSKKRLVQTS